MKKKEGLQTQIILMMNKINILILFFILYSCNNAEKEIFYIPKNYTGTIVVVFNQSKGETKEYVDNKRIYKISNDGVLFTQFPEPRNNSRLNQKFYYIENENQIINEIMDFNFSSNTKNKIYKFNSFSASIKSENISKKNNYINCMYFSIGGIDEKDSLVRNSHNVVKKLIQKLK